MSATAQATSSDQTNSREQGRVLVVTDAPRRDVSLDALERAGFAVVGVASGAAALVALRNSRPHVVVADASLLKINAEELTRLVVRAQ